MNWIPVIMGATAAFFLSILVHMVDVDRIEAKHQREMTALKESLIASCENDKQITKDANDDLQKKLTDITHKRDTLKRLLAGPRCVVPAAVKTDNSAGGTEHAGLNGISVEWLRDYAATCEGYRVEVTTYGAYIDKVWEVKNH